MDITAGPLTDALVVLAGPRRVGKSVTLMDSVDALCRRSDIDPRQIIHIPCDQLAARDLRRVLGDDTVVATGSRWVKGADAAANLFAGRAGLEDTRRLRHVAPMSFRDYLIASCRST